MEVLLTPKKPAGLCALEGCNIHVKAKRRKYCSRECHEKAISAKIPKCGNPECDNRVKRERNTYCSWKCFKKENDKGKNSTCQRIGCESPLVSRKSTRKYCSPECYKLDRPNLPSRKVIRLCTLPGCGQLIKRRGSGRKFCSLECTVKFRQTLKPIICPTCELEFSPKRDRQKFCSTKCRHRKKELKFRKLDNLPRRFTRVTFPQLNISKEGDKWILTSVVTWEKTNGQVPKGMNVWFLDNNTFNDMDINNLYLVEHKKYLELKRKVTQRDSEKLTSTNGKYEGRVEKKFTKQDYYKPSHAHGFF